MLDIDKFSNYCKSRGGENIALLPSLETYVTEVLRIAHLKHVRLMWGNDFSIFKSLYCAISKYGHVEPIFDIDYSTLDDTNSLFVVALDQRENVVASTAAIRFNWENTYIDKIMNKLPSFYYNPTIGAFPDKIYYCDAFGRGNIITNTTVYCGATWVRKDYRGLGFATLVPKLVQIFSLCLWSPHTLWGFIDEMLVKNKIHIQYGMVNIFPAQIRFLVNDEQVFINDYIAWVSKTKVLKNLLNKDVI